MQDRADKSIQTEALLIRVQAGEGRAESELLDLVQDELHGMAQRFMADQRGGHTLQATALVNEAWMKLASAGISAEGRAHFLRLAAAAMRSVLVDHARKRTSDKRGGGRRQSPLSEAASLDNPDDGAAMLALDEALERIAKEDERSAQVAEMRLFAGMDHSEVAASMGISTRTVERLWMRARAQLQRELEA